MAKTKVTITDDVEIDPAELEEVEVNGDIDAWMAEMLAGPSEDDWGY